MIGFAVASQIPWSESVGAISGSYQWELSVGAIGGSYQNTKHDERIRVIHEFPMLRIVCHTSSIIAFLRTLHKPG